jgi:hypothetical protein
MVLLNGTPKSAHGAVRFARCPATRRVDVGLAQ